MKSDHIWYLLATENPYKQDRIDLNKCRSETWKHMKALSSVCDMMLKYY